MGTHDPHELYDDPEALRDLMRRSTRKAMDEHARRERERYERGRRRFQNIGIALLVAIGGALWLLLTEMQRVALSNGRLIDATPSWAWLVWLAYAITVVIFCNVAFDRDDHRSPER